MTTAHRPTFDPAQGKEALRGPAYHQRLLAAHTQLKVRQPGQGTTEESSRRDLRAQLLEAESKHFKRPQDVPVANDDDSNEDESMATDKAPKRLLDDSGAARESTEDESVEAKRRRILEETRAIDADSEEEDEDEEDSDEESDEEDETAELMRELEKIKKERAQQRETEEAERNAKEQEEKEKDIAYGNPLLNPKRDFGVKRRWDDDVVFKNQARGTEDKRKPEFINDMLRSDFHKRFMHKYVR